MQPIILLGVAVAAVALVSTGFLAGEPWNEFELWVQQLGWEHLHKSLDGYCLMV